MNVESIHFHTVVVFMVHCTHVIILRLNKLHWNKLKIASFKCTRVILSRRVGVSGSYHHRRRCHHSFASSNRPSRLSGTLRWTADVLDVASTSMLLLYDVRWTNKTYIDSGANHFESTYRRNCVIAVCLLHTTHRCGYWNGNRTNNWNCKLQASVIFNSSLLGGVVDILMH